MTEFLKAENVCIKKGDRLLVEKFTHAFYPGSIIVFTGENGAGKSSLLNCLAGIERPTEGSVHLESEPIEKIPSHKRAQKLSAIGQSDLAPNDMIVAARIAQGLAARLGFQKLVNKETYLKVEAICHELNIFHLIDRPLLSLSGGEKKRVHIARALIDDQALIYILDEPEAGLDLENRNRLVDILQTRSNQGKTVIVSLHDINLAQKLSKEIVVLGKNFKFFKDRS